MSDSPMTEDQGRKIISLLTDILWELKQMAKDVDRIDITVSSIERNQT